MIERIIHFSIENKFIIGLLVAALIGWGSYSLTQLPIDAIPDITNNQVQIISLALPLPSRRLGVYYSTAEVAVANIPDIIELRSISRLGLSVVTVVFRDGVDIYWARQQLNERIRKPKK
ncbi:MAG: efflux RND transporter permease subunit [Bacteroidales bacterium]